ncbi:MULTISPECIES: amidohydrolase family protein [Streptomyces]|uniref:Amidohydrolase family protein n=1 Tax=Streptomyces edwardsiae TaxID=3075527 RepID=A0ABU2PRX6_9ACTN|nr:amidohydrolase family protein [Streptomyces sp. DSM 41636]MDT0394917.1 amidohydrolase family protein [Streptomyces sp. DSM 41636]
MTVIDAHLHVWDPTRAPYDWLGPALSPIDRAMRFTDARPELRAAGVTASVLVQAADHDADTDHMLATAAAHPEIVGVVAWLPLDDPGRAATRLAALRRDPHTVGVRALIHEKFDPDWIVRPDVGRGLALLAEHGLTFDYVTSSPEALAHIPELAARHPGLRLVVDHLGKPPVGGGPEDRTRWRGLLAAAARHPQVHAKVSGLYSARGPLDSWTTDGVRPYVEDALELFGPHRLMYGGDWPISVLAGGYTRTWEAVRELLAPLAPDDRADVLGGTAARFYRIDDALLDTAREAAV